MSDCKEWRETLGAFALGSLHPDERTAVLAHLDGCAACRDELEELEDARRALDSVEIDRVVSTEPPEHLYGDVFSRIGEEQKQIARKRMRIRVGSALAAAAVMIAAFTVATRSDGEVVEFASAPQGVQAVAVLTEGAGGVAVHLTVSGLKPGTYGLWMEGYSGTRLSAGTFEVVEGEERIEGNFLAGWDRDECAGMGVTVIDGADVLTTELPHATG